MLFVLGLGDALETRKRAPDGSDPERNKCSRFSLRLSFLSVCPEPVLANGRVFKRRKLHPKTGTFSHLRSDWLCNTTHTQSEFHFISRAFTPIWGEILADCNETMEGEVRLSTHSARPGFQS